MNSLCITYSQAKRTCLNSVQPCFVDHRAWHAMPPNMCQMVYERMCQAFIQDGKAREVVLQHVVHNAQPSALKAVLVWMYTERLEIGIDDVEAVKRIAKKCKLKSLVEALVAEQRTLRYYFKTVKREEQPRRYTLWQHLTLF